MTQRPIIIEGWAWVPLETIGPRAAQDKLVKELIHVAPKGMHSDEPAKRVPLYSTKRLADGYLGVPRAFAERVWAGQWPIVYATTQGAPMIGRDLYTRPDPNHPSVREPAKQRQFMDDLAAGMVDLKTFLATAPTGCHAAGTMIRMFNGDVKAVEDVQVGDRLLGPDGLPRAVLRLCRGRQTMARVIPTKGEAFVVNLDHRLSLRRTREFSGEVASDGTKSRAGEMVDVTVSEWLGWTKWRKHIHKLWRPAAIQLPIFPHGKLPIDPYLFGVWLGDGSSRTGAITTMDIEIASAVAVDAAARGMTVRIEAMAGNRASNHYFTKPVGDYRNSFRSHLRSLGVAGNKHIPKKYLFGSLDVRRKVLAGIIDTDGHLQGGCFEIAQKSDRLATDILTLCRSLGLAAYKSVKRVGAMDYNRIIISGDLSAIPTKLARKQAEARAQKKSHLVTGFTVELLPEDQFYGFTLSGDHLYMTEDFTVHHNSGKTVSFLDASLVRGRATFVMVHLERLMHQWKKVLMTILNVPEDKIAWVQQDQCDWQGKDFGIGLYHSLVARDYGQGFYDHWGTLGCDEVHKVGSAHFAPVAPLFLADVKVGLSATMGRKDRGDKVFIYHLGPIRVKSTAEYLPMDVHVMRYKAGGKLWGTDITTRFKCLAADPVRNRKLAKLIAKAYERNRQGLIVSLSIEHLQELMKITHEEFGVPYRAMGRFFGQVHLGTRDERDKFGNRVKKKLRKKRSASELEAVMENAQLIFATYGMMTEGIDIPRLDWGLDVLPQGKATQITGRIRRPFDGKDKAVWITPVDEECAFSQKMFLGRCKDYRATGATIIDSGA